MVRRLMEAIRWVWKPPPDAVKSVATEDERREFERAIRAQRQRLHDIRERRLRAIDARVDAQRGGR